MFLEKVGFVVKGMDCAACAFNIERVLSKTKGVLRTSVNFAAEKAMVEFDPKLTNVEALKKVVQGLGYEAI